MRIEYIHELNKIKEILNSFDKEFKPYLSVSINDLEDYAKKLEKNAITIAACNQYNKIIGFCSFYCNDIENKISYIAEIAVLKEFRKNKVAQNLLNECIRYSKENGMKFINLEVFNDNIAAQKFYEKNNFVYLMDKTDNTKIIQKRI